MARGGHRRRGGPIPAAATLVARIWTEDPYPETILGSLWTGFTVVVHVRQLVHPGVLGPRAHRRTPPHAEAEEWTPERLPEPPRGRVLGLKELVGGLGFVALVLAWLPWQAPLPRRGRGRRPRAAARPGAGRRRRGPATADRVVLVVALVVAVLGSAESVRGHLRHRVRLS